MKIGICALSAFVFIVISIEAHTFSRLENLPTPDRLWLLKFGNNNSSGTTNGTGNYCNGLANSSICGIRDELKFVKVEERKSDRKSSQDNKFWYESLPIPPVVIATSETLPEGACKRQLARYLEHLRNGTLWATQMFDASVKYPNAIIDGQNRHLGGFDQCYRIDTQIGRDTNGDVEKVQGRYCLVDYKFEQRDASAHFHGKLNLNFDPNDSAWEVVREKGDFRRVRRHTQQLALCIPAVCKPEEIEKALQGPFDEFGQKNNVIVKVNVDEMNCQAYHEEKEFSTGAMVYCGILFSIFALVIISSLYDGTLNTEEEKSGTSVGRKLLLCFSAKRNFRTVMEVRYDHRGLDTIHMIRFFSTALVLVGHRMMQYFLNGVVNKRYLELTFEVPSFIMVHNGPILVDGFFGVGGLLTCYGLLCQFDKTKRCNFIGLTLIRFLRFTPAYALLVFFHVYLFPYMGSGPQWKSKVVLESENCAATWWANLFYLNNYISMERLCIFQSWYLAVDFHCYLLGVGIIWAFWKLPRKIGYSILGAVTFISILLPFYQTYMYRLQPLFIGFPYLNNLIMDPYFINHYVKSHLRMTAYWVGVICGAILYDYGNSTWRISKIWAQGLFILLAVLTSLYSQSLGYRFLDPNVNCSSLEMALYASLHRGAFALAMCSIVLLVTMGDGLDFHYNFLTPRWVQPLGRLTYGVFLVHNLVQSYHVGTVRTTRTFTVHSTFWDFIPDVFYSFFLALLISLGVEGPFRRIEKLLLMKRTNKVAKKSSNEEDVTEKIEAKKVD